MVNYAQLTTPVALMGQMGYYLYMIISGNRSSLLAISLLVAASWVLPASATELQPPSSQNAVSVVSPKKKPARPRNIEMVSVEPLTIPERVVEHYFPIILGVAY
jgi:hypothetical protein